MGLHRLQAAPRLSAAGFGDITAILSIVERAAAFYSLIETAKMNGRDPEADLKTALERIANHSFNRIAELLLWDFSIGSPRRR